MNGQFIKSLGGLRARRGHPPNDLRGVVRAILGIARVYTLWRKGDEELPPDLEARFMESRENDLVSSSRVGRTLKHNELSRMEIGNDFFGGSGDIRDVRVFGLAQRRWHTDTDSVKVGQHSVIIDDDE